VIRYGLDAPRVVLALAAGGVVALALAPAVTPYLVVTGAALLATAAAMIYTSAVGKLGARDQLLDLVDLVGGEQLLDVGCGRGLLLVGAAQRLPQGRAVGVDVWRSRDQAGTSERAARANARAEGVEDRIQLVTADARELPFADASFDVVVSSLTLHNLRGAADRARAVEEIVRVLRPGGRVGILDIARTREYAETLQRAGLEARRIRVVLPVFPPARLVVARRP
jgi:ubiquinone/menaquinone biosynthesis C-methylase UbiE